MRVLLDARPLQGPTGRRGVGAYVRQLARGLVAADRDLRVTLLSDGRGEPMHLPPGGDRVDVVDASHPPGPDLFWSLVSGPAWCRRARADLLHATFLAPPRPAAGVPLVATVHDLIPLDHPRRFTARQRWVSRRSLALAARAARVVAVSRTTAERFASRFPRASERVVVVPPPVDVATIGSASPSPPPGIESPYLLHLSGLDPLKGFEDLLLPAFARLRGEAGRATLAVTAPEGGPRAREARRIALSLGVADRLVFTGHLDEISRAGAIAAASAVVVPSRDEGFGLPVVEALAAGVPVAVGPSVAAREASGGCGYLAPDATPEGLALAIERAVSSGRGGDLADARRAAAAPCAPKAVGAMMRAVYSEALEAARGERA